jgi:hypothetical protein
VAATAVAAAEAAGVWSVRERWREREIDQRRAAVGGCVWGREYTPLGPDARNTCARRTPKNPKAVVSLIPPPLVRAALPPRTATGLRVTPTHRRDKSLVDRGGTGVLVSVRPRVYSLSRATSRAAIVDSVDGGSGPRARGLPWHHPPVPATRDRYAAALSTIGADSAVVR